jgi:hypothetical protein
MPVGSADDPTYATKEEFFQEAARLAGVDVAAVEALWVAGQYDSWGLHPDPTDGSIGA